MKFSLFFLFLLSGTLWAQQIPSLFTQERVDFCEANLSFEEANQLRLELVALEDYFIERGLLIDKSGVAYKALFQKIVNENDLTFSIDTTFQLLSSVDIEVFRSCYFKMLTPEELSQATIQHYEAFKSISEDSGAEITPSIVAQRIIDNLSEVDFELAFLRISSLYAFYIIASPAIPSLFNVLGSDVIKDIKTIAVSLTEDDQVLLDNQPLKTKDLEQALYDFLIKDPEHRGIEFSTKRKTSYQFYLEINKIFDKVYERLKSDRGVVRKHIFYQEPD
jgi:hypothetical protein